MLGEELHIAHLPFQVSDVILNVVVVQAKEDALLTHYRLNGRCLRLSYRQRLKHTLYVLSKGMLHWGFLPTMSRRFCSDSIPHGRRQHLQQSVDARRAQSVIRYPAGNATAPATWGADHVPDGLGVYVHALVARDCLACPINAGVDSTQIAKKN